MELNTLKDKFSKKQIISNFCITCIGIASWYIGDYLYVKSGQVPGSAEQHIFDIVGPLTFLILLLVSNFILAEKETLLERLASAVGISVLIIVVMAIVLVIPGEFFHYFIGGML